MTVEPKNPFAGTEKPCLPPALSKPRLRRHEASEYLAMAYGIPISPATLATYVTRGGGPAYQKVNRIPLYPREALDDWATEKLGELRGSSSTKSAD